MVRIVVGVRGTVRMRCQLRLRFDYGALPPWSECRATTWWPRSGRTSWCCARRSSWTVHAHVTSAEFDVSAGDRRAFVLSYGASHEAPPAPIDAEAALRQRRLSGATGSAASMTARRTGRTSVRRSLITLKAMIHAPTGGLVAAPTTSLPEAPGGKLNWDYRYCWLRDASFTLCALLNAGFHEEATAWRDWLLRAIAGSPERLRIMYRVDGSRHLSEWTVEALPGYRYASPVRIGNAASTQHQIDVFGEVLDALDVARRGGVGTTEQETVAECKIVEHLEKVWNTEGSGVWESRSELRQYTYSKVMAWVGLDRFLRTGGSADRGCGDDRADHGAAADHPRRGLPRGLERGPGHVRAALWRTGDRRQPAAAAAGRLPAGRRSPHGRDDRDHPA